MKQKITKLLLFALILQVACLLSMPVEAAGKVKYFQSGDLYYHTISGGKVEVCGTTKGKGTLEIPSKVTYKGKQYKVTQIADHTVYFQDRPVTEETTNGSDVAIDLSGSLPYRYQRLDGKMLPSKVKNLSTCNISKVVFPETITYIGEGAFCNCKKLQKVSFAKKYKTLVVGKNAFGNNKIKSLNFPKGTKELKDNATGNAYAISIPATVKKIGAGVVNAKTKKVIVKGNTFKFISGILYTKDETQLLGVSGKAGEEIAISSKTTKIRERAFAGTKEKKVILNSQITEIPKGAFYQCKQLEQVQGTEAVTTISYAAFAKCPALKTLGSMEKLTKVGRASFWQDEMLSFTIGSNLTDVDTYAFSGTVTGTKCAVSIAKDHAVFGVENQFLTKKAGQEKIVMLQMADATELDIPDGITDVAVTIGRDVGTVVRFPASLTSQEGTVRVAGGSVIYKGKTVPNFGEMYDIISKKKTVISVPTGMLQAYKKAISDVGMKRDDCDLWSDDLFSISEYE